MKKLVIASTCPSAGKTSLILGIAQALGGSYGYVKPIGDRLLYRKKRLWDHDAALFAVLWQLQTKPEDITIGFEHAKLRYMYDEAGTRDKVNEMVAAVGEGRKGVFIEAGADLSFGASVNLDPIALAKFVDGDLLLIVGGGESNVQDHIHYYKRYINDEGARLCGVVVNQIRDLEDFEQSFLAELEETGIPILGLVPRRDELRQLPVRFLVERLFARVIAGEQGTERVVENIFLGAMSVSAAVSHPLFEKPNKLIITSGDRSDMILAAMETDASCVVLTNNMMPPNNMLARATEAGIPLLLVPWDTYTTVQKIGQVEPLITIEDAEKIRIVKELAEEHVKLDRLPM